VRQLQKQSRLYPLVAALLLILLLLSGAAKAQDSDPKSVASVIGVVIEIDKDAAITKIKTDGGAIVTVKTDAGTICLRIPAGEKTLAKATPIQFADIAVGDRVLTHGAKTDKEFLAQRLVVMTKAEVEKKREHDLAEWQRRGIGGIVRDLNPQTGEINLELRGAGAGGRVTIATSKANFRRYASGSLRFEDARSSGFGEVKVGDQLRALGEKNADGRSFAAEEIISGAFKTVGVTVVEVNLTANEIKATTLDQKKPVVISINKDSALRRISPPLAATIAQKAIANRPAAPTSAQTSPAKSTTAASPATQNSDVQQLIDALPAISLSDLKAGDTLAVTSAVEKDDSRMTAIKLTSGVDLVLKAMAPAPGKPQVVRLSAGLPTVFDFSVIPIN
jgi:hypothetical protein